LLNLIDQSTGAGDRLYCVLVMLIDTGISISELVNIQLCHVDFYKNSLIVTGKGQKQRTVPFSSLARKPLLKYMRDSRSLISNVESNYLFPSQYGDRITINSVQ